MSLVRRALWARIPRRVHESIHRWANGAVIPLVILLGGTYRVLTTAATPFEEYIGVAATASVALGWAAVFVHALPLRHGPSHASRQTLQQTTGHDSFSESS